MVVTLLMPEHIDPGKIFWVNLSTTSHLFGYQLPLLPFVLMKTT